MRIGLSSLIGDGFGNGSFVFGEVPSGGGGFPAYGTFLRTDADITYPIVEGGEFYTAIDTSVQHPIELCYVDVLADGFGGEFYDWANAYSIYYLNAYTEICTEEIAESGGSVEVPTDSGNYSYSGEYPVRIVFADGSGGVYYDPDTSSTFTLYPYGTFIYDDGTDAYYWDGDGSYYTEAL